MFYFSDTRCAFPKGRIQVQTEFPFYEPGNVVNGKIFIEAMQPLAATHIEIEVKGGEKAAFTRYWMDGDQERWERIKHVHRFAHYKMRVFEIPGHFLNPGSYAVSFQFTLPFGMPSSIYYKNVTTRERPKAKIKYFVKAIVHALNMSESMKYKQIIAIREKPVQFKTNEQQQETSIVKTWCCIDQGVSSMWSTFEKNIYTPQETARAMIHVDNSRCQLPVTRCRFFIEQRMTIRGVGPFAHTHSFTNKLIERDVQGPQALQGGFQTELLMNLNEIRYEAVVNKKKKGVQMTLSPEDLFAMTGLQPACHSRHITNEYFICIELEYDGCTCCSNLPDARTPLTIVPLVNPACFGFQPPNGFIPYELGLFAINLAFIK